MRRALAALFIAFFGLPVFVVVPAYADRGYGGDECESDGGYCAGEDNRGDCRNTEKGANCEDNDFSPSFDKSPVENSFNPQICVMPGSCSEQKPES